MLSTALIIAASTLFQDAAPSRTIAGDSSTVTVTVLSHSAPQEMVLVRSANVFARTDSRGIATLRLPAGSHSIVATRIGLRADSILVAIGAGRDTAVTIHLESAELKTVVVSATRSERRIEHEPLRVEVLGQEEVEEKLLMTPGDITMMLNESSGLRVQVTSPSLGGASVRVQGLRGRYTQLLADGLPLYGGQTGGLGLLQIPPMDLAGVEVIKGVASALYGGSALGGVINLRSRGPESEAQADILANQTTLGGTDLVAFVTGPAGANRGYTALAGAHRQSAVDKDDDGWTDIPGYERLVIRPRVFWTSPAGNSAMMTVGSTAEIRDGGNVEGSFTPDGSFYPERLTTKRYDAGGTGRWILGTTILSARGSAATQRHWHTFGDAREQDRHVTWFGEAAATFTRGSSTWVAGTALQQERYTNTDVPAFDFTYTIPSLFGQATFDAGTRVSATASARIDAHSEYGTQFSPRLSALVRLTEGWVLRMSAGAGYFAPTPFTEETEVTGLRVLEPFGKLEVERAVSGSVDLGGTVGELEVNATLFASTIADPVGVRTIPGDESRIQLVNLGDDTRTRGAELLVRWNPEPFHVTMSYTHVRSSDQDPRTQARRMTPLTPRNQAGVVAAWEREGEARAGLEIYYTGRQSLDDNPYRQWSRPYMHVGAMIERRFGRMRVFVNSENLLDYRQTKYDRLVLPQRGAGGRWTTDVWGPLEGRVANVGVRLGTHR